MKPGEICFGSSVKVDMANKKEIKSIRIKKINDAYASHKKMIDFYLNQINIYYINL